MQRSEKRKSTATARRSEAYELADVIPPPAGLESNRGVVDESEKEVCHSFILYYILY